MKNIHEIAANAMLIGGMLATGGAIADYKSHPELQQHADQRVAIEQSMREKYGVTEICIPSFSGSGGACAMHTTTEIPRTEELKIIQAYEDELEQKEAEVPGSFHEPLDYFGLMLGPQIALLGAAGVVETIREKRKKT